MMKVWLREVLLPGPINLGGCGFWTSQPCSVRPRPYSICLERWLCLFLSTEEVDDEANLVEIEEVSAPIWRAEKLAWQRSVN